ncbi:O-antigen polymerase [Clostridium sp. DSM 8431]|uniref:O-antigen polymerase n=1 Tax=Clostridium sp. DSM 8431 TaxID=1761781 RepID=UPI00241E61DF|nr:O-antigen polymerase [Clostridium sp. DSM 8431]
MILQIIYFYICLRYKSDINLLAIIIPTVIGLGINSLIETRKYLIGKVFLIMWLGGYYISFFNLSSLQYVVDYKTITRLYIFLIGFIPIIIEKIYSLMSKNKRIFWNKYELNKKQNIVVLILFIIHICIYIYESKQTGIPLFIGQRVESIGAIHVAGEVLLRVVFYVASYNLLINKKYICSIISLWGIIYSILTMSRSLTIHFTLYVLLLSFVYRIFSIKKIISIMIIVLVFFGVMGNVRNGSDFNINEYASMKIDNKVLGWIYCYIGPNYDNLALQMQNGEPTYTLSNTLSPIITVLDLDKKLSWYDTSYLYIGKLNIGTIYRDYVCDWGNKGAVFLFSITIFIINCMYYNKRTKSIIRIIILSEVGICFFTNHFTSSVFWLGITIVCFIDFLSSEKRLKE